MSDPWKICAFKSAHDPETLEPRGRECGRPAVKVILWRDGRRSPACTEHGVTALDSEAAKLVERTEAIR